MFFLALPSSHLIFTGDTSNKLIKDVTECPKVTLPGYSHSKEKLLYLQEKANGVNTPIRQ
jgi:hypothetical protein